MQIPVRSTSDNASIYLSGRSSNGAGRAVIQAAAADRYNADHRNSFDITGRFNMASEKIHEGSCFCGEVQFEVSGEPAGMGYCHCESCRHWSAGPVNAFTLWNPQSLKVTHGADSIGTYNKTPISFRKWCKKCGGHLFTDHPTMGLVDIYAAMLPKMKFEPGVHVHYQDTVLPIRDGKPKFKDMPKEMGGSGINLAE
jgi:hypothetical protein